MFKTSHGSENGQKLIYYNGSGKSAIITAIAISLGTLVCSTNRRKRAKGLIKNGKNACVIKIHVYRKIAVIGSSEHRFKIEVGKTISTKKDDFVRTIL